MPWYVKTDLTSPLPNPNPNPTPLHADNAAKMFGLFQDTPWRGSIKLVQVTAGGLDLPPFNTQLLETMAELQVESWAAFTTRLVRPAPLRKLNAYRIHIEHVSTHTTHMHPLSQMPGAADLDPPAGGGLPLSAEGGHQRCFESLLVCTEGLRIARWPLHEFGRLVARTYHHWMPPEALAVADRPSSVVQPPEVAAAAAAKQQQEQRGEGSSRRRDRKGGGGARGRGGGDGGGAATQLTVVFQQRQGHKREIVNAAELMQRCNEWGYTTPQGRAFTACCIEVGAPCRRRRCCCCCCCWWLQRGLLAAAEASP